METQKDEQHNSTLNEKIRRDESCDPFNLSVPEDLQKHIDTCKSFIIKEVNLLSKTSKTDVLLIIFEMNQIEYSCATSEFKELRKRIEESTIISDSCKTSFKSLCDPFMVFTLIIGIFFQLLLIYFLHKSFLIRDNSVKLLSVLVFLLSSTIVLLFVKMFNQSKKRAIEAWESKKAELGDNNVSRNSILPVDVNETTTFLQSLNDLDPHVQIKKAVSRLSQFTYNTKVMLIMKNDTSVFTCATPSLETFLKNLKIHGSSGSDLVKDFVKVKESCFPTQGNQEKEGNIHKDDQLVLNLIYSTLLVLFYFMTRKFSQY